MKRIKIMSDGSFMTTRILDAETGEDLSHYFTAAQVRIEPDALVKVHLTAVNPELEIVAEWDDGATGVDAP